MLSAIAARKGRLGLVDPTREPQKAITDTPAPSTPSPIEEKSKSSVKSGTKRRHVHVAASTSSSKRNKSKPTQSTKTPKKRYFEEELDRRWQDVMLMEEKAGEDSDEGLLSRDEEDIGSGDGTINPIPSNSTSNYVTSRKWSPSIPIRDSSDDESEAARGMDPPPNTTDPLPSVSGIPLSTFHPVLGRNTFPLSVDEISHLRFEVSPAEDDAITLVVLNPEDSLALLGTYSFFVLHGYISICGVTVGPRKDAHCVFAPKSSPVPVIRSFSGGCTQAAPSQSLSLLPQRFSTLGGHQGAVVVLQGLRTGIEGLGLICATFDGMFEPLRIKQSHNDLRLLPSVHLLSQQTKDIHPFVLPRSWEETLSSSLFSVHRASTSVQPLVCMITGPKKTGKSTLARTLVNRLLASYRRIAFMECDPGQSEFTPAGMIALNIVERPLFGPPFSHPTIPISAHYVGTTSPRSSPSHYLLAIQELLHFYRLDVKIPVDSNEDVDDHRIAEVVPLVVNTMGWNKGLGADLTLRIEEMLEPTDIFKIQGPSVDQSWPMPQATSSHMPQCFRPHGDRRVHILEPVPAIVESTSLSPANHRILSILSYFHAVFPSETPHNFRQTSATSWNTALPLCAYYPYQVDCTTAFDKVILIGAGMEDVVPSEIERVLNGAVVGMVSCEPGTVDLDERDLQEAGQTPSETRIPYTQGSSAPSPSSSVCHGLALIRALSPTSRHMHIITPLPSHQFSRARVLVKGELEFPIWGMLDFRNDNNDLSGSQSGVDMDRAPFLQWGKTEGIGTERRRVRRNLMRKGQM